MTPHEVRRLRAADHKRLRNAMEKFHLLTREAVTAAACSADSARMAAAEQLGIVDYDCATSTPEECLAVWSHADVRHASRIYDALGEAHERIGRARELMTGEEYNEE